MNSYVLKYFNFDTGSNLTFNVKLVDVNSCLFVLLVDLALHKLGYLLLEVS